MEIRSLDNTNFDTVFRAFSRAFADYELQLDKTQLETMLTRRGYNPELSFAAFEGDEIVAFTLNGTGEFNGVTTAYDTGTGTVKEFRGQGLATRIFEFSIPYLQQQGIKQYLLEVLQHNTQAVSVYRNLGFEVSREFYYFNGQNSEVSNKIETGTLPYSIRDIEIEQFPYIPDFWDFHPSWQNSFESIKRGNGFISKGVFKEDKLIGYGVFETGSGDITQLAVDKEHRRQGIASLLLKEMTVSNKIETIKAINTDITCQSITAFLESKNIPIKGKQYEMIKTI